MNISAVNYNGKFEINFVDFKSNITMTSFIVKPIYSDDNKGATFEMWKDPIRMDKWLQNPSPNHTRLDLR